MIINISTEYPLEGMTKVTASSEGHTLEKCVMYLLQDMYPDTFTLDTNFPTLEAELGSKITFLTEETKMTTVSLPFSGFYHGFFDYHFDNYAEAVELTDEDIDSIDFNSLKKSYCEHYVHEVSHYLGTELKFAYVHSPREYNFSTDKLYVEVPNSLIENAIKTPSLQEFATKWFTSRSGFISFYNPDINTWDFDNLDIHQLSCAFAAYLHDEGLDLNDIELYMDFYFNL